MSETFQIVSVGTARTDAPATPKDVPHRGGEANPSAEALRAKFGAAVKRVAVVWGETTIFIDAPRAGEIIRWLHDDPSQQYDYLSDVTAVEYRDFDQPIEVVWHLRFIPFRRFLRLKAELAKRRALVTDSVYPIYKSADWMEREVLRHVRHRVRVAIPICVGLLM